MKKLNFIFPFCFILTCCIFLSACGLKTTYMSPTVTVDEISVSDVETAASKAVLSSVSIYTEGATSTGTMLGMGSGVIYKINKSAGDAYIVTNYHVIYDSSFVNPTHYCSKIKVELYGSEGTSVNTTNGNSATVTYGPNTINADIVGGSLSYDLAVLKISNSEFLKNSEARAVDISSAPAHLAQSVLTVGNALGMQLSVTTGIVSKESEYVKYSDFEDVIVRCIRIDAPINSGNSGGGLFDGKGNLLGIVNAGNSNAENVGSALPATLVVNICDNIIYGYETGSYSGLKRYNVGITVSGANSKAVVDQETGLVYIKEDVIITALSSPANNVGLSAGEIIDSVEIGGESLTLSRDYEFAEFMFKLRPGMALRVTVKTSLGFKTVQFTPFAYQN